MGNLVVEFTADPSAPYSSLLRDANAVARQSAETAAQIIVDKPRVIFPDIGIDGTDQGTYKFIYPVESADPNDPDAEWSGFVTITTDDQ